ncbi:MAG: hypothetical protein H6739_24990 [Alphaproteobacteria bacterium]|nr:hypothetical protein [Alphaproteobacteria bacterium]
MTHSPLLVELADLFTDNRALLHAHVRHHFPNACRGQVEDAVSAAFLAAMTHPDRFARALAEGGEDRVLGLFRVVAWRAMRAWWRRGARRHERLDADASAMLGACPAGQQASAVLHLDVATAIQDAAVLCCRSDSARICAAVADRLASGDTDTDVARRHGVRREYVNRVRREVARELLEAA